MGFVERLHLLLIFSKHAQHLWSREDEPTLFR